MGKFLGIAALLIGGLLTWRLAERLSPDAIGMAVGLLFGILAGLPVALLVLATQQRTTDRRPDPPPAIDQRPYPPVIVLTGGHHVPDQNRPQYQRQAFLSGERRPHPVGRTLPDPDDGEDWD